jgi:serine/threonine-protein kinase
VPPDNTDKKTQFGTGMPAVTPAPGTGQHQAVDQPPAAAPVQTPLPTNVPAAGQAPAAPDPLVGTTLNGRYYVEKKLGEGGMGAVYAAQHITLEKRVALKVLHGEFTRKPDLVERFLLEAKSASKIRHENVIDISDFGQTPEGAVFFAMEFLEGRDLHDVLARAKITGEPIPWSRNRDIFLQICAALSAAHSKGIVHRDLKPENIYLVEWAGQQDFVKLLDFGIAKMTEVDSEEGRKLTRTGMLFGTPEYMSPEQARGDKADHRVDIYAMGCILYQLIVGEVPFKSDNFMGILSQHLTEEPPPVTPEQLSRVGAPPALASVVMKALAKEREDRFQTIDEMADAVRAAEGGQAVAVPATPARKKTNWVGNASLDNVSLGPSEQPRRGAPVGLIVGGLVGIAAIGGLVFFLTRGDGEPAAPAPADPTAGQAPVDEAPLPDRIAVALTSEPSGARVVDVSTGDELGTTPFDISMPGSKTEMRLRLEKEGYQAQILLFTPDQDVEHAVQLRKAEAGKATAEPKVVVVPRDRKPSKPATRKPEPKADKPEPKPDKPEPKADKPEPKADKPEPKPKADKPEPKPDKPEPKPDKPEPKPDNGVEDPKIKNPFGD